MSTSPSWFDQDKFSRLVKKVGTTTRSVGASNAPNLPASSPSAPSSTGPIQLSPVPPETVSTAAPEPEASAVETPIRATASAIPKPSANVPIFTFKATSTSKVPGPRTTVAPVTKTAQPPPEPAPEQAPEEASEPPPAAPARVARVFLAPAPAEVSATEPVAQPPEPVVKAVETAPELQVAEQPRLLKKPSLTTTSTLQRLPRIMPGGSKPPPSPTQTRSVSTLSRRTTSLPGIKPMTAPPQVIERAQSPVRAVDTPAPPPLELVPKSSAPNVVEFPKEAQAVPVSPYFDESKPAETVPTWESAALSPDEIAAYKEQIAQLNEERDHLAARVADLSLAARERDEASLEAATLRGQLAAATAAASAAPPSEEIALLTGERDSARRDYIELRQQYETLKHDQLRLKNELAGLQKQLETSQEKSSMAAGRDDVIETLKQELKSLHEQVAHAKDEASTAQRGLALSQKALQETRDTLREVSDAKGAPKAKSLK